MHQTLALAAVASVIGGCAASEPLVPYKNVTFASLNTTILSARVLPYDPRHVNATFAFEATCCGYGPFTEAAVEATSAAYGGLWDLPCGRPAEPEVAEWGYEFFNNKGNIFPVCGNLTEANYTTPPADRAAAQERVRLYWLCRASAARMATPNATSSSPVLSEIGHYLLGGHSALWGGVGVVGSEVGENINSINLHLAMTRGAARQFGVPFLVDFSAWMQGYILDYSSPGFWGTASSPVGGHSISLFRRTYYAAYMGGAGRIVAEAGAVNFFFENTTTNGTFNLSPLGEVALGFSRFAHAAGTDPIALEAWRGVAYVPVALLVEQAHGMGLGYFYNGLAWDAFIMNEAESRMQAWFQALWPDSFTVENDFHNPAKAEADYMVGGAYGDIADVLLAAPGGVSSELLQAYRVVVAVGVAATLDASLAAALSAAVEAGGLLILEADDVEAAGAWSWFPGGFFGASLTGAPPTAAVATGITDVQTGWVGPTGIPRRLSLPAFALDPARPATTLLELSPGGEAAALVHAWGAGSVVLLLGLNASTALNGVGAGGLGVVDHLLARVANDTAPVALQCGGCDAGGTGLQVLSSRSPGGWNVTLINDLGVTKEPATPTVEDAARAVSAVISLRPGFGTLAAAWQTTDALFARLPIDAAGLVNVTVPAGGVFTLGLDVVWP